MKYKIIYKEDETSFQISKLLKEQIQIQYDEKNPDYVIVVGGDGTFLSAVHKYPSAIFFAIHTGHLGFYANYDTEDLETLISDINQTEFQVENLDVISCQLETKEEVIKGFAINEMTIIMPPKPLILDVQIDEQRLETFRGTGLCISTPYGSTAYNKSLFGAVVDPLLHAFQLTEIAGINSNQYRTLSSSLMLEKNRSITLEARTPLEVHITLDQVSYILKDFLKAKILLKEGQIKLAHHHKKCFIERIRRSFLKEE